MERSDMSIVAENPTSMRLTPPDSKTRQERIAFLTDVIASTLFRVGRHLADGTEPNGLEPAFSSASAQHQEFYRAIAKQAVMSINRRLSGMAKSHAIEHAREDLIRQGRCDDFLELPIFADLLDRMGAATLDAYGAAQRQQWDGVTR
jgi:hypothetical protein